MRTSRILPLALAVALLGLCGAQGWAASSGGGGRAGGTSASSSRAAAPKTASRPGYGAKQQWMRRRSLLAEGPLPSPAVRDVIVQKESSGPGWMGTALLVYLLSQHDLSKADKAWIEDKMCQQQAEEEEAELPPINQKASLQFHGLNKEFSVGRPAQFSVTAKGVPGAAQLVCDYPEEAVGTFAKVDVSWTPLKAGSFLVSCRAGSLTERRLVRVL